MKKCSEMHLDETDRPEQGDSLNDVFVSPCTNIYLIYQWTPGMAGELVEHLVEFLSSLKGRRT
jgi:hypothetical protein